MSDRVKAALERLVRRMVPTDYHAVWPATVVYQTTDGLLDVRADDDRIGSISGVPIRYGIPGVTAKVKAGSRVCISFEGGSPQRPIATVWESASIESVTIVADRVIIGADDGAAPIARQGDAIQAWMPALMPISGTMMPAGAPPAPFTGFLTIVETIYGQIITGATKSSAS